MEYYEIAMTVLIAQRTLRVDASVSPTPPANLTPLAPFARLRDAARLAYAVRQVSRAEVAELADARGSGPRTRKGVGVRVPSSAPTDLTNSIQLRTDQPNNPTRSALSRISV